jgi:hypothetical protein
VGVFVGAATRPILIAPFTAAALLTWIVHRVVQARHGKRQRIATIAVAPAATDGAPYRGGADARDQVDRASLLDSLRAAGLAPQVHRNAIRVRTQDSDVELAGFHGPTAKIADLALRYSDPVAALGPMVVAVGVDRVDVRSPDALEAWRTQHELERAAITSLADALDRGRDTAIKAL